MSRRSWFLVGLLLVGLLAFIGGPWVWINVLSKDAPDELSLQAPSGPVADVDIDTAWTVAEGSVARYRVDEVLFGQGKLVVGETSQITGSTTISDGRATGTTVTVDMASLRTDDERRDNQFRGRIMDVAAYPHAAFRQTVPVDVADLPEDGSTITVVLTGDLTLRGVTRTVDVGLDLRRSADGMQALGTIPIVFADYSIPEPSIPGISVADHGELEFLVNLMPA